MIKKIALLLILFICPLCFAQSVSGSGQPFAFSYIAVPPSSSSYSTCSSSANVNKILYYQSPSATANAYSWWYCNNITGSFQYTPATVTTLNLQQQIGPSIASATTIAPVAGVFHVTGTAAIATITPPIGMSSTIGGCLTLIADGAWSTTTAGNIYTALTATAGNSYTECYDGSKWYVPQSGGGGGSISGYYTTGTGSALKIGVGPTSFTPSHTFDCYDATATTGSTVCTVVAGASQAGNIFQVLPSLSSTSPYLAVNQYGSLIFGAKVTTGNGVGLSGNLGFSGVQAETGLSATLTTAQGTSSSPIVLTTTNIGNSAAQPFDVACYMTTATGVASSSVSLYITWTDPTGTTETSAATVLTSTVTGNIARTGYINIMAKNVQFSSTTNIGYYTVTTGAPQYQLECKVIVE